MKPKRNYKPGPMDECGTPAYALEPLLSYLKPEWRIWEPACGEGLLSDALSNQSFAVIGSDILYGEDFLTTKPKKCAAIVTNPPFSRKVEFLQRCYDLGKPFALLLPVEVIGTKGGQEIFERYPYEWIFVRPRINFKMPNKGFSGSAQFPTFWTTHGLNIGQPVSFFALHPIPNMELP